MKGIVASGKGRARALVLIWVLVILMLQVTGGGSHLAHAGANAIIDADLADLHGWNVTDLNNSAAVRQSDGFWRVQRTNAATGRQNSEILMDKYYPALAGQTWTESFKFRSDSPNVGFKISFFTNNGHHTVVPVITDLGNGMKLAVATYTLESGAYHLRALDLHYFTGDWTYLDIGAARLEQDSTAPTGAIRLNGGDDYAGSWTYQTGTFARATPATNPVTDQQVMAGVPRLVPNTSNVIAASDLADLHGYNGEDWNNSYATEQKDGAWRVQRTNNATGRLNGEILMEQYYPAAGGQTWTEFFDFRTDGTSVGFAFSFFTNNGHHVVPATIEDLGAGWKRAHATRTLEAGATYIRALDILNFTGNWTYIDIARPRLAQVPGFLVEGWSNNVISGPVLSELHAWNATDLNNSSALQQSDGSWRVQRTNSQTGRANTEIILERNFSVSAGQAWTESFFFRADGSSIGFQFSFFTINGHHHVTPVIEDVGMGMKRAYATYRVQTGDTFLRGLNIGNFTGDWTYVDISRVQLEPRDFVSSWIAPGGERAAETVSVPTSGVLSASAGTWEQWVYVNAETRQLTSSRYGRIFDIPRAVGGYGVALWHEPASAYWALSTRADDGTSSYTWFPDTDTPDGWNLFTVTWSTAELKMYLNGVLWRTVANPRLPSAFGGAATVGSEGTGQHLNATHGEVRISAHARDAAGISASFTRGQPFTWDGDTRALVVPEDLAVGTRVARTAGTVTVRVDLPVADDHSGVTAMRFSVDGTTWGDWQTYAAAVSVSLPTGDGTKTVSVQFRDAAGNISPVYSDSIVVATEPTMGLLSPTPGSTAGPGESLSLTVTSPGAVAWNEVQWRAVGNSVWQSAGPGGGVTPGQPFTVNWPVPVSPATYDVRVKLSDAGGQTGYSNLISLTLPAAPELTASSVGGAQVRLAWTGEAATAFALTRSRDAAFPAALTDTLTTRTTQLTWQDAVNSVRNGSFEAVVGSSDLPEGWSLVGSGSHTVDHSASKWGTSSLKMSRTSAGDDEAIQTVFGGPGLAGKPLTISGWFKAHGINGGGGAVLTLNFVDRAGNVLGQASSNPLWWSSNWRRLSVTGWVPAGTWWVEARVQLRQTTGTLWADGIQVEPSTMAGEAYSPGTRDWQQYFYRAVAWNGPLHSLPSANAAATLAGFSDQLGIWYRAID